MPVKKRKTILIVEDDSFLSGMYAAKFEMENFAVLAAEDGEKGLRLAKEKKPDIILLDLMLPKMDGFEVLQAVRADKEIGKIPIILLTNLNQKDKIREAQDLGISDYLIKAHFMPSEVIEKVKNCLNK